MFNVFRVFSIPQRTEYNFLEGESQVPVCLNIYDVLYFSTNNFELSVSGNQNGVL